MGTALLKAPVEPDYELPFGRHICIHCGHQDGSSKKMSKHVARCEERKAHNANQAAWRNVEESGYYNRRVYAGLGEQKSLQG